MVDLAWYAPLGGALILGAMVFGLARFQQRRFSRRYDSAGVSDPTSVVKAGHHHA